MSSRSILASNPSDSRPYFHTESLKQRFTQDVMDALVAERIDEAEASWLLTLVNPRPTHQGWNPPRLDSLIKTGGLPSNLELAAAVQISYPSGYTIVYLNTLLYGLERFDDREQLLATLLQRFGSRTDEVPTFEDAVIERPLFEHRMFEIIDHQVEKIEELAQHLGQLPSLHAALKHGLQQAFVTAMPDMVIDPSTHLLQIVQAPASAKSEQYIAGEQNLMAAVLDDFCGVPLLNGSERRYIDLVGKTLDDVQAQPFRQALVNTIQGLSATFETQLGKFWWSPVGKGQTRREYVADALADAFRQQLYARRHDAFLSAHDFRRISMLLDPHLIHWGDGGPISVVKLAFSDGNQRRSTLAGVFVLESVVPSLPELIVYSAEKGLRRFRDRLELWNHFSTPQGCAELLKYLPLQDHAWVNAKQRWALEFDVIDRGEPFWAFVDSIISLQNSNLLYALKQPRLNPSQIVVMIDDALDVRHLIDQRLIRLGSRDRWHEGPATFDETWRTTLSSLPAAAASDAGGSEAVSSMSSWIELIRLLDDGTARMWKAQPKVAECARAVLNKQLAVIGEGHLDAGNVQVQLLEPQRVSTMNTTPPSQTNVDLVTLLLERASGHRRVDISAHSQILITPETLVPPDNVVRLTPQLLNYVLDRAKSQLLPALTYQTQQFDAQYLRRGDRELFPAGLSRHIWSVLLRTELDLARRLDTSDVDVCDAFEQALNFPVRSLRGTFGNDAVEVHSVWLTYKQNVPAVQMTNVFVVQQPLRTNSKLLFWAPSQGMRVLDSVAALKLALIASLRSCEQREDWLDFFPELEKRTVRKQLELPEEALLSIDLRQIDGDFITHLQTVELNRRVQGVAHAFQFGSRCGVDAKLFGNLIAAAQAEELTGVAYELLSARIQSVLFGARLPAWLKNASAQDLDKYAEVLMDFAQISISEHGFLFGIPYLNGFAREQVIKQLQADFPDQSFDPNLLQVTLTRYVGAPTGPGQTPSFLPAATDTKTESLTAFALNHFAYVQGATLSLSSTQNDQASTLLTPTYLRTLIRTLDVGAKFQQLLAQKLDSSGLDYPIRKALFLKQWPAMMIELAFQKKLEGPLTSRAYDYIEALMNMPDHLAQQPVHGEAIALYPLQLIAKAGAVVDTIPGFYVIAPKDPAIGPVILYSVLNSQFCFKEYVDRDSLLNDIRKSSNLQSQVMQRVSADAQARYGHHSFNLPPLWSVEFYVDFPMFSLGPVALNYEPIQGNILTYLFEDTVGLLKQVAKQQTVTTAQADWESFTYLMTLGVEQMLIFLPGELGEMIAAWQSLLFLESSAASVASQNWGQALGEFTVALSILALTKQSVAEAAEFKRPVTFRLSRLVSLPEYSWQNTQLPAQVKRRLQAFEASEIALGDLLKDELLNVYQAPMTLKSYAAVAGKVYEVHRDGDVWHIIKGDKVGPNLRLNQDLKWELNIHWGLKGGGGNLTRIKSPTGLTVDQVNSLVDEEFSVLATGMPQIRQSYRERARQIGRAHLQAKRYVETCLDNLSIPGTGLTLHPKTNQILTVFFGVQTPSAELVGAIKKSVTGLFNSVMDASLAPYSSPRFVIGLNRIGNETTVAFTLKQDPLLRIYLSELFFRPPLYQLKTPVFGSPSFELTTHSRAATVIHELSHLSNDTFDIAYLESTAPFLDLMADDTPTLVQLKADVEEMQQRFLSHQTPIIQLFKHFKNGRWEDLNDDPGEGKVFILGVTGKENLVEARVEFLANDEMRGKILLNNADSLTLLIMLLGRDSFMP
ncbi:hypothetical protein QN366_03350 [Pseudomonas sp. CCC3.2]|uniref:dermonecrotic toxin domain-containing protein n=1 Tax=unclassified Pseudomonas TaxID=196821 RepID=UPI002AB3ED49|nr:MULTISPECIES: DUF6543 domain-containing protein [unclassified Pseudomonas]MDY7559461.1 hypothetical protein [Pseudomonas sp. AB6]MEB0179110.1 hypothetical protein [Pseudomonas sp. CCC3.2]MEB0210026.1 hypothetical protein [Pseudomonas sp. AB6]